LIAWIGLGREGGWEIRYAGIEQGELGT